MKKNISLAVVRRLPRYYRYLAELQSAGVAKISSKELSERMGLTASQIRQDLNCFGGFGQQGYGYNVDLLFAEIGSILGLERKYKTILIGLGNLGKAISQHITFSRQGFELIGIFDVDKSVVGEQIGGAAVMHMDQLEAFCRRNRPEVAVLTLPKCEAASIAYRLEKLGVRGFWNLSNADIHFENKAVPIENVHLVDSLMTLCYRMGEE